MIILDSSIVTIPTTLVATGMSGIVLVGLAFIGYVNNNAKNNNQQLMNKIDDMTGVLRVIETDIKNLSSKTDVHDEQIKDLKEVQKDHYQRISLIERVIGTKPS
jgi:hypothetical protein